MIRARRNRVAALVMVALGLYASQASAQFKGLKPTYNPDDPYQVPDAPAPPTLPDLTHRALALSLEVMSGSIRPYPKEDGTQANRIAVALGRLEAELAISNRRWYLGYAQELATGRVLSGDVSATVLSNPEFWGRALWASKAGLAYGGGIGFVPPLLRQDLDEDKQSVRANIRVLRPWDYPHFAGQSFAVRPFVDVRSLDGPIMLQLRQGLDILQQVSDEIGGPSTTFTSRTTFYIGYRPIDELGIGLELWEVYFIKSPEVSDDQRAVFAVSPSIRWMTRVVQPAMSMMFPVDRPLFNSAKDYWALRLTVGLVLDPSPPSSIW